MYKKEYKSEYTPYESQIFRSYFEGRKIGFFDIETTGLSPFRCKLILSGFSIPDEDGITSVQFLADDPSEEPLVIKETLKIMDQLDMVVTYNGKTFDMPFLEQRCKADKIHISKPLPFNLDLYQAVKYASPLKSMLPNLKQKTVESYLGLWATRTDEISGAESVELYYHYAGTKDEKIRDVILLHNADDIRQLSKLLPVLDKCDLHKALFKAGILCSNLFITDMRLGKTSLKIHGIQRTQPINASFYDDFGSGLKAIFRESEKTFEIRIPIIFREGYYICDVSKLPLKRRPANETNGYLILQESDDIYHEAINRLVKEITENIYEYFNEPD